LRKGNVLGVVAMQKRRKMMYVNAEVMLLLLD
jgi:hypothetical protein